MTKSLILFAVIVSIFFVSCSNAETSTPKQGIIFFSTSSVESNAELLSLIYSASSEISVASPVISNSSVCNALVEMRQKGLKVSAVIDMENVSHEKTLFLSNHNIPVHSRGFSGKMNSSFALIDNDKVFAGSINSCGEEEISCAMVIQDEDFVKYISNEYVILNNGVSPSSKDSEFDLLLGPLGSFFSPAWFLSNQISIDDGSIKGRWPQVTVPGDYIEISPYLSPYPMTERKYHYYVDNAGIYKKNINYVTYYDYEYSKSVTEQRNDFTDVLVPLIDAAEKEIIVVCTDLSDKRICSSLVSASMRGVSVKIYADYESIYKRYETSPLTIDKLCGLSDFMTYKTSINGGISENVIVIDEKTFVYSSSSLCRESFISDDSLFWVSCSAENIMLEFSRQIRQIKMRAVKFIPED